VGVTSTTHQSGALGFVQGDAIRDITGNIGGGASDGAAGAARTYGAFFVSGGGLGDGGSGHNPDVGFQASRMVPTANENRPVNVAVRYLIKSQK
jgi:hypothetical protein